MAPSDARADQLQPAAVWYSEQFALRSAITGRDYLIQVSMPDLKSGERAPAVYQTDGNSSFGIVAGIVGPDGAADRMQRAFVVGIGYPVATKREWLGLRQGDLTTAPITEGPVNKALPTGGAAMFLRFVLEELRPLIEARYAVDPDRAVLSGQSFGGLFTAYALLKQPAAFSDYIIGSPSFWSDRSLLASAASFAAPRAGRVFIGVGAGETDFGPAFPMVDDARAFAEALSAHSPNLTVQFWEVPGENHFTVNPALYARALRFVLPPAAKPAAS